jgi:hypothetical protein
MLFLAFLFRMAHRTSPGLGQCRTMRARQKAAIVAVRSFSDVWRVSEGQICPTLQVQPCSSHWSQKAVSCRLNFEFGQSKCLLLKESQSAPNLKRRTSVIRACAGSIPVVSGTGEMAM